MKPVLVILAAGASERLGQCKALARIGPATALEHLLAAGAGLDGAAPLVVAGADFAAIRARAPRECEVVENALWREGRSGSVQLACRLRPGLDLCVAPVDVPLVPASVFAALVQAWERAGSPALGWLAPCLAPGPKPVPRHGHPVVLGRELARGGCALDPALPLRAWRARAELLLEVEVAAGEIREDLDLRADLERMRKKFRAS